jgi:nucleoside-diphosphate-sugar epimerase
MKAAVVGRPYHIRFGGKTDFQYVADTASTFIHASISKLEGAHVFNLHGETVHISQVISEIERIWPAARGQISHAEEPLAIPAEFDDSAIRSALGPLPFTPLADGVEETIDRFAELQRRDRLDITDLNQ